jgi:hypothetical protein
MTTEPTPREPRVSYVGLYKIERRKIETENGQSWTIYVPVNRVLGRDARDTDGLPVIRLTRELAEQWCKEHSPKVGWRK